MVPDGYDVGLLHTAVNNGVAAGFFLAEDGDPPLVEEQQLVGDVAVDTTGLVAAVAYGLGPRVYRLRLALRGDVLDRTRHVKVETPASLRALLLSYAAQTTALTLQLATGDRQALLVEALTFASGPAIDGYVARLTCLDVT